MQPACGVYRRGRRLGLVEVLLHDQVSAGADLAHLPHWHGLPCRRVGDLDLGLRKWLPHGKCLVFGRVVRASLRDQRRRLGLAVDDAEFRAEAGLDRAHDARPARLHRRTPRHARSRGRAGRSPRVPASRSASSARPASSCLARARAARACARDRKPAGTRALPAPGSNRASPSRSPRYGRTASSARRRRPARDPRGARRTRALLVRPRWCSSAPLGEPVVPDVYWICAASSGATFGQVDARAGGIDECAPVLEPHDLAQAGQPRPHFRDPLGHRVAAEPIDDGTGPPSATGGARTRARARGRLG